MVCNAQKGIVGNVYKRMRSVILYSDGLGSTQDISRTSLAAVCSWPEVFREGLVSICRKESKNRVLSKYELYCSNAPPGPGYR